VLIALLGILKGGQQCEDFVPFLELLAPLLLSFSFFGEEESQKKNANCR
jgi:hypothetical protein